MPLINSPDLWKDKLPAIKADGHKYDRGVAVIYGAPKMTGATRLAAEACARIGAGLVKVIAPESTGGIYRNTLPAHIIVEDEADFGGLSDLRISAFLAGPGMSGAEASSPSLRTLLAASGLRGNKKGERLPLILDAGALEIEAKWHKECVMTPHEGEFTRMAPLLTGDKAERAQKAAKAFGAIIVLKGAETIISDGNDVIVHNRPVPELATAGTGDVLAGMITGLIAQGMDVRLAAAAAVWIHSEAGARFGRGLVASDLPALIPAILKDIAA